MWHRYAGQETYSNGNPSQVYGPASTCAWKHITFNKYEIPHNIWVSALGREAVGTQSGYSMAAIRAGQCSFVAMLIVTQTERLPPVSITGPEGTQSSPTRRARRGECSGMMPRSVVAPRFRAETTIS